MTQKTDFHRSRTSRAPSAQPNSEPCFGCDLKDHCKSNAIACNIFTRWIKSGKIPDIDRKFQARAF